MTIPYEIRQRVGFGHNDVLSFTEGEDGRTVIVRREKICDNCEPVTPVPQNEDEVTLYDFLKKKSVTPSNTLESAISVLTTPMLMPMVSVR